MLIPCAISFTHTPKNALNSERLVITTCRLNLNVAGITASRSGVATEGITVYFGLTGSQDIYGDADAVNVQSVLWIQKLFCSKRIFV